MLRPERYGETLKNRILSRRSADYSAAEEKVKPILADVKARGDAAVFEYTRMFENCPQIEMVSDHCTAFAVTDSMDIHCGEGRSFSLFSPDNSLKIKSTGLQWKTDDVVFDNWWKATLNRASEDTVHLEYSHKSIALVILD